jgi:hypothetical protein
MSAMVNALTHRRLRRTVLSLLATALIGLSAAAQGDSNLQIHGFAAQAAVKTDNNSFFGDSQNLSTDFREAGLNLSFRPTTRLMLAGQVISRRAGELYDGMPRIDYALAALTLTESATHRSELRIGRIKNPLGLYNATRDVPFTRPSIFMPQSVYFDETRDALLSTDGITLAGELNGEFGSVTASVGIGRPPTDENAEWTLFGLDLPGELTSDYDTIAASLRYRSRNERLQLGLSVFDTTLDYEPGAAIDLPAGSVDLAFTTASLQYDWHDWTLTGEYLLLPTRFRDFGPLFPFGKATGESWYLQGEYRLLRQLTFMGRYERGYSDRSDRDGEAQSAATGGLIPAFDFFDRGVTAGITWDINRHLMLRAEYSAREGTYILSARENAPSDLQRDWHYFALQVAVRF